VDSVAAATYEPEPDAVAAARRFVRDTLASWELPGGDDLLADAELLTSELVTNAVIHAHTRVQVTCRTDGPEVEVSVLDRQPTHPIHANQDREADASRATGRGLLLTAAMSSSWGVTYGPAAKTVWFRLPAPRPAPSASPGRAAPAADTRQRRTQPVDQPPSSRHADLPRLDYQELLNQTAERARDAAGADSAYVLIADEHDTLRMRAAAGTGPGDEWARGAEQADATAHAVRTGMGMYQTASNQLAAADADAAKLPRSFLSAPVLTDGHVTAAVAVLAAEPERFTAADSARLRDVVAQATPPLERARIAEHDRAGRGRISFLAEASDLLAGTLDQEQAIALGAQLVVPRLATWCAVLLVGPGGQLALAHVWHADEARNDALRWLLSRVPAPQADFPGPWLQWPLRVPSGEAPAPDASGLAGSTVWCFPMLARGRSLGILVLGQPNGVFGWPTTELAGDLAHRVALALDNARLYSAQLRASHALQRSLLPPQLPVIPCLDIAAGYQAAGEGDEVGGDFYDIFQTAPDRWRFAIGDVCGKGMEAASVTGLARHALRILAREGHDVPAVLGRLNSIILADCAEVQFLTLIYGEIKAMPGHSVISIVCAGHPLPLLLRAGAGVEAAASSQPLIGVIGGATFHAETCRLRTGDLLLCVTDGVTERRAGDRLLDDDNGLQVLLRGCSGLTAGAAVAKIQRKVLEYGPEPPADDIALLVLRGT
jgi:serine phosphatase RsbU (regulator of sigma subunit)/anti-sigma regulatory factor (Ser/Thr protein kinase)